MSLEGPDLKAQFVKQRNRHASGFVAHAEIIDLLAERLIERLDLVTITPERVLDIGSSNGKNVRALGKRYSKAHVFGMEPSATLARQADDQRGWFSKLHYFSGLPHLLPFPDNSIDLVVANLYPLWLGDPKLMLAEISRVLTPNGLYLFSSLGPDSLVEIRQSWSKVDRQFEHTERFIDMHDIGDALTSSGFHSIVMENEPLTINYSSAQEIHQDLKQTGFANLNPNRRKSLTGKAKFRHYLDRLNAMANPDISITLDMVFGHGWKGQQKPKYPIHDFGQDANNIAIKALD